MNHTHLEYQHIIVEIQDITLMYLMTIYWIIKYTLTEIGEQIQQTMVVQEEISHYTRNLLMLKVLQDTLEKSKILMETEQ